MVGRRVVSIGKTVVLRTKGVSSVDDFFLKKVISTVLVLHFRVVTMNLYTHNQGHKKITPKTIIKTSR